MPKFFIDEKQVNESTIEIIGSDVNHIENVLRLTTDDEIIVCDNTGFDYLCKIVKFESSKIVLNILKKELTKAEPRVKVTLYQGLPKKDKMELIIQKSIELGINKIVPVTTERTIVKIKDDKKYHKKLDRWNKIAEAAAKQSGRGLIPEVDDVISFNQALKNCKDDDLVLIAYEKEDNNHIKTLLRESSNVNSISIFIGPEGGFSEDEINDAINNGIKSISLGKRILRTETAGFVLTSVIMYELDEM